MNQSHDDPGLDAGGALLVHGTNCPGQKITHARAFLEEPHEAIVPNDPNNLRGSIGEFGDLVKI